MENNKIISNSEKETFDFGYKIGKELKGGEIFALSGDLGAGKTVFTQGLAKGLGCNKIVNSPTFVVMKIYNIENNPKILKLCHIDAYRLKLANDLENIGVFEYFERPDTVTIIEWPENIKKNLPDRTKFIKIKDIEGIREIIY